MKYIISMDIGTQSAKIVVYTLEGKPFATGNYRFKRPIVPKPGQALHPDDDIWDGVKIASKECMQNFEAKGGHKQDLLGIGLCVQRYCRVMMKADGNLAYPVMAWMDIRISKPYAHEPEFGDVKWVTTAPGYISHRLTGLAKDSVSNYSGWWPVDYDKWDWSDSAEVFKANNLTRDMLFDLQMPATELGKLTKKAADETGFPEGLPVICTGVDKAVDILGAGINESGTLVVSLGTYIASIFYGEKYQPDNENYWVSFSMIPNKFIYETWGVRRGMWTVGWFKEEFGDAVLAEAKRQNTVVENIFNQEAEKVPAGCDGLLTVHDFGAPTDKTYRKGALLGFDGRHTRAHIYRSILEGIAFRMKHHYDRTGLTSIKRLVICGGGANSDLFMQIFADIFELPVQRNEDNNTASIGCLICAGVVLGIYKDYDDGIAKTVRRSKLNTPNPANFPVYRELLKVQNGLHEYLDPPFMKIHEIVDKK